MDLRRPKGTRPAGRAVDHLRRSAAWWRAAYGGLVVAAIVLVLGSRGYVAITGDHHQYLLPVLQAVDPAFAAGDWFAGQTTPYHYTFQLLLTVAQRFDATTLTLVMLHGATLLLLCIGIAWVGRQLGAAKWALPVVLFVLRFGIERTWGDVNLIGQTTLPHYIGLSLALVTIAATFGRRYGLAAALLVATAYAHVSVGFWTVLVTTAMVTTEVVQGKVDRRHLLRPLVGAMAALVPLMLLVASDFIAPKVDPDAYRILFNLRAPHHYAFVEFGLANHVRALVVVVIALVTEHLGRYSSRALRTAVVTIVAVGLCGAFFLHVVYWPLPVRLFPYRLAPLITALAAILAVALVANRDIITRERLIGGVAVVLLLSMGDPGLPAQLGDLLLSGPTLLAVPIAVGAAAMFMALALGARGHEPASTRATAVGSLLAIAFLTVALALHQPPRYSLRWLTPQQQRLGDAVGHVVPVGELLIVPPDAEDARLATGRGIVVDFKAFPMVATEMQEWRRRLEDVTGMQLTFGGPGGTDLRAALAEKYRLQRLKKLQLAGQRYGATYLLVHEDSIAAQEVISNQGAQFLRVGDQLVVRIDVGGQG